MLSGSSACGGVDRTVARRLENACDENSLGRINIGMPSRRSNPTLDQPDHLQTLARSTVSYVHHPGTSHTPLDKATTLKALTSDVVNVAAKVLIPAISE
jgi:hypothetical protein